MGFKWMRAVGVMFTVTVGVAGCGGSSSSSGLSKADLAKQTNAICNQYNSQIKGVPQPSNVAQDPTAAAAFFDKVAPLFDQALTRFKALNPSASVKAQWEEFLAKVGALTSLIDQLKAKADAKDKSGVQLLTQIQPLTNAANAAANTVGATDCSK